jgi:hypothetical protein
MNTNEATNQEATTTAETPVAVEEKTTIICAECGYPFTRTELYKRGPKKGQIRKNVRARGRPLKSVESAIAKGWVDTGQGLLCPKCGEVHKKQEAAEQSGEVSCGPVNPYGSELVDEVVDGLVVQAEVYCDKNEGCCEEGKE